MHVLHKLPPLSSRFIVTAFFLGLIALGLFIFTDYGFALDEHVNRENGAVTLLYILSTIEHVFGVEIQWAKSALFGFHNDLGTYRDRDYGVAFDLPAMLIERIFHIDTSRNQFLLRHLLTNFVFLLGLYSFYLIIKKRFSDWRIGLLATAFMFCSPRIFAESFYNNKDIVFMSLFITALYFSWRLIDIPTIKNSILSSLFSALAIDVRIIAVIIPIIVLVGTLLTILRNELPRARRLSVFVSYLLLTAAFTVLFWPWLWTNPLAHFAEAVGNMVNFRWINWVLYRGHYYPSNHLPWHYLPIWIAVTTPVLYLLLAAIGTIAISKTVLRNGFRLWGTHYELQDLMFLSVLVAPIAAAVLFKSTIYDGWRQFYFIYPALIYIAVRGLVPLWRSDHSRVLKPTLFTVVLISVAATISFMISSHPYQNVYFNHLAGSAWAEQYEGDYWGLSNTKGLKFIADTDQRSKINIYNIGITSIPQAFAILPDETKTVFEVTDSLAEANYAITNFRFANSATTKKIFEDISRQYKPIYSTEVDGQTIVSIFKLR
jgi:hypothetical protein